MKNPPVLIIEDKVLKLWTLLWLVRQLQRQG